MWKIRLKLALSDEVLPCPICLSVSLFYPLSKDVFFHKNPSTLSPLFYVIVQAPMSNLLLFHQKS